jgi:RecA/RadA recombinase
MSSKKNTPNIEAQNDPNARLSDAIRAVIGLLKSDNATVLSINQGMARSGYTKQETQIAVGAILDRQ